MHTAESPSFRWSQAFLSSHFAPAFYFLKPERRRALKIIYAVFRVLDDAVDKEGGAPPAPFLAAWRTCFEEKDASSLAAFGQEQLGAEFVAVCKEFDIPIFSFLDFLSYGMERDIQKSRFETPMETESYCYGVAGTVGVACLPIFGVPWKEAKDFAVRLGITVQWINTIRDVGVDADMDRIYLPLEHVEKFGCREEDILAHRMTPQFAELIRYEAGVARAHYRRAQELLPLKWKRELLPARIMGEIYLKLLAKIEKHEYPVLTKKIKLNLFEKGIATLNAIRS